MSITQINSQQQQASLQAIKQDNVIWPSASLSSAPIALWIACMRATTGY